MRGRTAFCLCLLLAVLTAAAAQATTHLEQWIDFDPAQLSLDEQDGMIAVSYPGATTTQEIGAPDLPTLTVWVEIPADVRVVAVEAEAIGTVEIERGVLVRPVHADRRAGEPLVAVTPDAALYGGHSPFPDSWATLGTSGALRGHRVVAVLTHPVRWEPDSGRLIMAKRLRLRLEMEHGATTTMLTRHRVVPRIERRFEQSVGRAVRGFQSQGAEDDLRVGDGPAGPGPYQPTFRPTTDGSAVEYVIVTNQAMLPQFQRVADWKTKKGVQAAVRTVEWIDTTYPNGVDRAERLRFFLRDAYQNWGSLFVMLGGDTDVIPVRYGYFGFLGGKYIPADYYYGCLDGNWNADGDDRFGEARIIVGGDEVDFFGELSVGRVPVSTAEQAEDYIDKLLIYEQAPPEHPHYPASLIAMAERLFINEHGADIAEQAIALMPPWFEFLRLYEESGSYPGSFELSKEAAIDSLNHGFGMVLHVGHGYRNTMSVGDGTLGNSDADNLLNGPRNPVVFAINCSSAAIDFNSIGERWVKNPDGGSVIYIGTSRNAYVVASTLFQHAWFEAIFVDSVGAVGLATDIGRLALVPQSMQDSAWRWNLLATTLLGDPELQVFTHDVAPLEVSHSASFTLGSGSLTVSVSSAGSPVENANVTLIRDGEAYGRAVTDASGSATIGFLPETAGDVELTVARPSYYPYQTTIQAIDPAGPFLHSVGVTVDDDMSGASIGDGDGRPDAGETIELTVAIRNGGAAAATGVFASLSVEDPAGAVTIQNSTVAYDTINPGGQANGLSTFRFAIDPMAPVAYQPIFQLAIGSSEGSWSDLFVLGFHRPYLEHYRHDADDSVPRGNGNGQVEMGEEIWFTIDLRNTGQDRATGVAGELRVVAVADSQPHPLVTVLDNQTTIGTVEVDATVTGDRFEFQLDGALDPADILLEVTWTDDLGPIRTEYLDVIRPSHADTVKAYGSSTSITLLWLRPDDVDIKGYDIYRSENPLGPFMRINSFTADGSATYEDPDLPPLTRYYYNVVARDSSYNEATASMTISGTTNPPMARGWPIAIGQQSQSSPTFANTSEDAAFEFFTAGDFQYGWHADGREILDGDGDERTSGVYSMHGYHPVKGFSATTAIGDLDRDLDLEIVNTSWGRDSVFVWDHEGALVWKKSLLDDYNWPSPVLADLDGDFELEVIVWAAKGGRLFAWHSDGTEVIDGDNDPTTDGVMYRIFGTSYNYSSPAVADIDSDPELEIIFCVNHSSDDSGEIHAINPDGTLVAGWPVATGNSGSPSRVTASPAVADLDGDGDHEIIFTAERAGGRIYVLNGDGTEAMGWPRSAPTNSGLARSASPVPVNLTGDSRLEIVYPGSDGQLYAWDYLGNRLAGYPVEFMAGSSEATQSTPSVVDIDGDGFLEILFGDEQGLVHGYNHDATQVDGFPIQLTGEVRSTPSVWDIDLDGLVEVMVQGWDSNMYVWDLPAVFNPLLAPWPMFRHDSRNTGWVHIGVLPIAVEDPGPAAGLSIFVPRVYPPYPNPFNPSTILAFDVPAEGAHRVEVSVYDTSGRLVRRLLDGAVDAGHHRLRWDGRTIRGGLAGSGVYYYHVKIDRFEQTGKLVLVQ